MLCGLRHLGRPDDLVKGRSSRCLTCEVLNSRHRPLLKSLPRLRRRRRRTVNVPLRILVDPKAEEFEARIRNEINRAKRLDVVLHIVADYGRYLTPGHISDVLSILAGLWVSKRVEDLVECLAVARVCVQLMKARADQAHDLALARCAFALSKLGLYDKELMDIIVNVSQVHLPTFRSDSLSGLVNALATFHHAPPAAWVHQFVMYSYPLLSSFTPAELSNTLGALSALGLDPPPEYVYRCMEAFKGGFKGRCHPQHLVKFIQGLVQLGFRPSGGWMVAYLGQVLRKMDQMTARELVVILQCTLALGHAPDLRFNERWCRALGRLVPSCDGPTLVAGWHVVAWMEQVPSLSHLATVVCSRSKELMFNLEADLLARLLWTFVRLRLKPAEDWMAAHSKALTTCLPSMSPSAVVEVVWCLGKLRYQPDARWWVVMKATMNQHLGGLDMEEVEALLWGIRRMGHEPPQEWKTREGTSGQSATHVAQRIWSRLHPLPLDALVAEAM